MPDVPQPPSDEHAAEPVEYTIDQLSATSGLPSRTIRFYQSKGALPKPTIRGRKAFYTEAHLQRLELIGKLQDRGLRIKAIRELMGRIDRGELVLSDWLGLQDRLQLPTVGEGPRLFTEQELIEVTGVLAPGKLAELVRLELLERQGPKLLCRDVRRLRQVLELEASGVGAAVTVAAIERTHKHMGKLARDLTKLFESRAKDGLGSEDSSLHEALEAWRQASPELISAVFAEEMQQALHARMAKGKLQG